ncbi:MAG: PAS domain S-box protein [Balneolaceae bacterium]
MEKPPFENLVVRLNGLEKAYRLAHIGTWVYDMESGKLDWSSVTKEVHGFGDDYEPDVESTIRLFKEGIDRETFARAANDAIEHAKPFDIELKIISGQGDERWIRARGEPEYVDEKCVRFFGISQDVTKRKQAEEEVRLNERRFKALVQEGADMIAILDHEGYYKYVSPTSETVLGYSPEDLVGRWALELVHPDDSERLKVILEAMPKLKRVEVEPYRVTDSDGEWRWLETTVTDLTNDAAVKGLVVNSRDISEKKHRQEEMKESLQEKEILLAEIHHRVKNNLAVVSGLLQLQASQVDDPEMLVLMKDAVSRVQTMAHIHEQLYQSDNFARLNFSENVRKLVLRLVQSWQAETVFELDFQLEKVELPIHQAIPCSLILNEVVSNIIKHAYDGRPKGTVSLHLSYNPADNRVIICVEDDGVGLPDGFDTESENTMGMTLIRILSVQIGAGFRYESLEKGTRFTLELIREAHRNV